MFGNYVEVALEIWKKKTDKYEIFSGYPPEQLTDKTIVVILKSMPTVHNAEVIKSYSL